MSCPYVSIFWKMINYSQLSRVKVREIIMNLKRRKNIIQWETVKKYYVWA